jgi:hypothetical protein
MAGLGPGFINPRWEPECWIQSSLIPDAKNIINFESDGERR